MLARLPLAVAAAAALLALVAASHHQASIRAQGATTAVLPDVQTRPIRYDHGRAAAALAPAAPDGQEGFGRTVVEVAGLAEDDAAIELRLYNKLDGAAVASMNGIAYAGGAATLDLSTLVQRAGENRFTAQLTADHAFGALARTQWASGGTTAYEAPSTSGSLLLPYMAVNTGTQSTILAAQHAGAGTVQVAIVAADPLTGDTLLATQIDLGANQGAEWDTAVERFIFDPDLLKPNAGGGFIGPLRMSSGGPVALIGYVDETASSATDAVVARPVGDAATVQILPRVRAAADGGTLIAVANAGASPVQATVSFAPLDGAGDAPADRQHTIPGHGAWYLDLSPGGRSLPAAAPPAPFLGSAIVTASGPILATAHEDWRAGGVVDAMAGYNAFGPRDLSDRWTVPKVRRATRFVSTLLVVHNPTGAAAEGSVQLADAQGAPAVVLDLDLPAGGSTEVDLSAAGNFPIGEGSAIVEASAPVAVVAYERRDASREYPVLPLEVGLDDERGSMIEGRAMLTPDGSDLRVDIELSSTTGSTYQAFIMHAACTEQDSPALHALSDVVGGRSSTVLPDLDLRDVGDGFHAIRLKRAGGGPFAGRVACGVIGEVRGVEVADSSASRAIPHSAGPATLPTAAPTGAASPTLPAPSATPTRVGPTEPRPTTPPILWVATIHLPVGHAGN